MFTEKQLQVFNSTLDPNRIRTREKGNITLSYVEGHDIIETANAHIGYGNWSYTITSLENVSQEQNQNQNTIICYKAVVRVIVNDTTHTKEVSREDVGFGTGIAKTIADAHEGGAKEAVTDALKRCFRTFGNQFGNSLYDRSKNHYSQPQPQPQRQQQPQQPQRQPQQQPPQRSNYHPHDYASLYSLGLTLLEQGDNLVIIGDDIFSKRDSIKACGFRWDGTSKLWYKPLKQQVA